MYTIRQFDYCVNTCKYYNYYDGWCYYHDKDTCEIDLSDCAVIKKRGFKK